jgi:hypothetical protein
MLHNMSYSGQGTSNIRSMLVALEHTVCLPCTHPLLHH